ncbi:hypothetical protein GmHk_15G045141 [Glycine max]|nr:hypothetical protein GmHk_15G045141 [Glycine max]
MEANDADLEIHVEDNINHDFNPVLCLMHRFLADRDHYFYHQVVQRVLKGGPWSFDKHMLILGVIKEGENPPEILLFNVSFSVQIHNLPMGFMSERVGQNIGNYLGKFLEYNEKNFVNSRRPFMHICVLIDKPRGDRKEVFFKFERLGTLCYLSGLMGHIVENCKKLLLLEILLQQKTRNTFETVTMEVPMSPKLRQMQLVKTGGRPLIVRGQPL